MATSEQPELIPGGFLLPTVTRPGGVSVNLLEPGGRVVAHRKSHISVLLSSEFQFIPATNDACVAAAGLPAPRVRPAALRYWAL